MLLLVISLLLFISRGVNGDTCQDQGISNYDKNSSSDATTRLTTVYKGNFTVQALITLTEGGICDTVTKDGVVKAYALKYAIEKANNNILSKYSNGPTLGLQIDDVCRSLPVTMARGIEVVSLHRPNSVCRADFLLCDQSGKIKKVDVKRATAVIGTQMSFTTIPLASLMSLYSIPHVSYAASSRLLSKKDLYKSFFRTIPSDTNQIKVMLDIFKKFDWNYVFAIGSDDDYGKLGVSDLKRDASARNVCVSQDEYIPFQSTKTDDRVSEVIKKIKAAKKATVVVLFCYVKGLGDKILAEAKNAGLKRVWLTSEAWNPAATTLTLSLQNQTEGILSVSLKSYRMPFLIKYMRDEIKNNWHCNMWLQKYLEKEKDFKCKPTDISADKSTLTGTSCSVLIDDIVKKLSSLPGKVDNLIDSATAISHGIHKVLQRNCTNPESCYIPELTTKDITMEMFNVSFRNEQQRYISFDKLGDPREAFYTIENIQVINGTYKYVPVGNWTLTASGKGVLNLNEKAIKWPNWFPSTDDERQSSHPFSRCSKRCQPGTYVVGKTGCCWGCQKCTGNDYTDTIMAVSCKSCGNYAHTFNHKECLKTPILWLEITNPAGMSITVISAVGMLLMLVVTTCLFRLQKLAALHDPAPHIVTMSCFLLIATYIYGPLHVFEPTHTLCQARNSIFFLLLMMYSAILLIKSKFMTKYLSKHADKSLKGNLLAAQVIFLALLFLLELVSVVGWLYIDKVQLQEFREATGPPEIWRQCEVSFTAARLVSTFIPCIVLIIATFCAFRERNMEHSFYEPKFLSFSCIALCIIIIAFLPTFKYVVGIYKAIVMAFTMDVFGFTFMACLIVPKLYVASMRHRRGSGEYPLKPGAESKKKEKKKKEEDVSAPPSMVTSTHDRTSSTVMESSVIKKHSSSTASDENVKINPDEIKSFEEGEEVFMEKVVNSYHNASYDNVQDADVENGEILIEEDDKPPPYEDHANTEL